MKTEQEKISMCRRYLEGKGWKCTKPKNSPPLEPRLLRLSRVVELVPLSEATIWRKVKDGSFPAPQKIGANSTVWRPEDIEAWIAARFTADVKPQREAAKQQLEKVQEIQALLKSVR